MNVDKGYIMRAISELEKHKFMSVGSRNMKGSKAFLGLHNAPRSFRLYSILQLDYLRRLILKEKVWVLKRLKSQQKLKADCSPLVNFNEE